MRLLLYSLVTLVVLCATLRISEAKRGPSSESISLSCYTEDDNHICRKAPARGFKYDNGCHICRCVKGKALCPNESCRRKFSSVDKAFDYLESICHKVHEKNMQRLLAMQKRAVKLMNKSKRHNMSIQRKIKKINKLIFLLYKKISQKGYSPAYRRRMRKILRSLKAKLMERIKNKQMGKNFRLKVQLIRMKKSFQKNHQRWLRQERMRRIKQKRMRHQRRQRQHRGKKPRRKIRFVKVQLHKKRKGPGGKQRRHRKPNRRRRVKVKMINRRRKFRKNRGHRRRRLIKIRVMRMKRKHGPRGPHRRGGGPRGAPNRQRKRRRLIKIRIIRKRGSRGPPKKLTVKKIVKILKMIRKRKRILRKQRRMRRHRNRKFPRKNKIRRLIRVPVFRPEIKHLLSRKRFLEKKMNMLRAKISRTPNKKVQFQMKKSLNYLSRAYGGVMKKLSMSRRLVRHK